MQTERQLVPLADGRDLDVLTVGPEDGFPLVVHEGTPGGLVPNGKIVGAAEERGLRVVMAARPGYEGSTPRPGRRVADVAGDVGQVLDALGACESVSIGFSGGGPHSLACAALLPGRCLAAASVACVGPYGVEGLDFLAGMGPENVEEFTLAVRGARRAHAVPREGGGGARLDQGRADHRVPRRPDLRGRRGRDQRRVRR